MGKVLTSADALAPGDTLETRLREGVVLSVVKSEEDR